MQPETTTAKKPAATRVYPITVEDGGVRYIEAETDVKAARFVLKTHIGKPLTGSEVAAIMREHGADAIESALS
jgi:hypothetical protein